MGRDTGALPCAVAYRRPPAASAYSSTTIKGVRHLPRKSVTAARAGSPNRTCDFPVVMTAALGVSRCRRRIQPPKEEFAGNTRERSIISMRFVAAIDPLSVVVCVSQLAARREVGDAVPIALKGALPGRRAVTGIGRKSVSLQVVSTLRVCLPRSSNLDRTPPSRLVRSLAPALNLHQEVTHRFHFGRILLLIF